MQINSQEGRSLQGKGNRSLTVVINWCKDPDQFMENSSTSWSPNSKP